MAKPFPPLTGKLVLAPMHNTTNVAFRTMCKEYGASKVLEKPGLDIIN